MLLMRLLIDSINSFECCDSGTIPCTVIFGNFHYEAVKNLKYVALYDTLQQRYALIIYLNSNKR